MNYSKLWFSIAGVVFIGLEWVAIFQNDLESVFFYGGLVLVIAGLLARKEKNE